MIVHGLKRGIKAAARAYGYEIIPSSELSRLKAQDVELAPPARLWSALSQRQREAVSQYLALSNAQLAQDLFVLAELIDAPESSYFVEFGATDGVSLSNT